MYSRAASARSGSSGWLRSTLTPLRASRPASRSSAARTGAAVGTSGWLSIISTR